MNYDKHKYIGLLGLLFLVGLKGFLQTTIFGSCFLLIMDGSLFFMKEALYIN